jgi:serine/threonine-protein kinase
VFKARDLKLSENVALKLLDTFATESTADARFKREVSLARRLSHANIVRIYDIAEHDQRPFLTMELLEGTDLRNYASKHRLELHQRLDLLRQTLEGLRHAHDSKVVHRDIKPENLFVTNQGELKIMDFGMAKAPGDASVTMAGSMGGTPYYMSPEQITDFRSADQRTDLYALGVVAYELFTGKLPFVSNVLTDLLLQHMERAPAPLRSHKPGLPESLENIVLKLMAKKRDQRFQSAAEVLSALAQVKF